MLRELGELGSVKAVADILSVTPSAVSQQISLLQRGVDTPLTRKDGRNLVLTEAGQVLADAGADVINAMANAHAAIGAYQSDRHGSVSIAGFHSAGQALFAPLVRRLAELRQPLPDGSGPGSGWLGSGGPGDGGATVPGDARVPGDGRGAPQLRLSDEDVAQHDFPALCAKYDLVLAHRMDHSPAWPEQKVKVIALAHEPLDVALAIDHPLAQKQTLSPADVVHFPWVTSRSGYSPADVLVAVGAMASMPVNVVHRINDYSTVAALVSTGEVIGLLPRYTSSPALNAGVALRPLAGINTKRRIDLLVRPENLKRESVRMVATALQEVMAGLTGG